MSINGPFSGLLSASDPLKMVYFKNEVLEKYFNDPQYQIFYSDYRGSIYLTNEDAPYEEVRDFGHAYNKDNKYSRAIVVFAGDLIEMPIPMQCYWYSYYLSNQDDYYPNYGFFKNLILGEWVDDISIYQALLMEEHYINKMCETIGLPKLFREEFDLENSYQNNRPSNYHSILLPTEARFFDFVITLEKITTGNINIKTFQKEIASGNGTPRIIPITSIDDDGKNKGSQAMLNEWLKTNIRFADIDNIISAPLKKLIRMRQTPAHKLFENKYDTTVWEKQNQLMHDVYSAIRNIRLLFANHPSAKTVEIPDYLYDGKHIRIY